MIKHLLGHVAFKSFEAGRRQLAGIAFLIGLAWLAGCSPSPTMPEPPRELRITDEYLFGTRTSLVDSQHWSILWDNAVETYDKENMRLERYVLPVTVRWESLRTYYSQRLSEQGNWAEDKTITFEENDSAWSFGFRKGNHFIALVGLQSDHEENGLVPINVITNLPE